MSSRASLEKIKEFLIKEKIDYFIQPNCDEFFSEYLPDYAKRLEFVTGFTGSNCIVIFGQEKSYFFTDGRYILQALSQLNSDEFEIINLSQKSCLEWINKELKNQQKISFDSRLFSINFVKELQKIADNNSLKILALEKNPIDNFWINQPKKPDSEIYFCCDSITGADSIAKRANICQYLTSDAIIITRPENICWLLNIRASDVAFSPILLAYGILYKDGQFDLFLDKKRFSSKDLRGLKNVNIVDEACLSKQIIKISNEQKTIEIYFSSTNYWLYNLLNKHGVKFSNKVDPISLIKSIKNHNEITGSIKSHEVDGLALTRFLCWFDEKIANNEEIDELSAAKKLLELRQKHNDFIYPSFATISSFASNGAIIHYQPNYKTNKEIKGDSLYLVDSGGQYHGNEAFGTTDVTRTILVGKASDDMVQNFTRVLKGHIALARAKFPKGTNGSQLDVLARFHLWQAQLNYDHGTGHGVGSFLSVHEGPCGISKNYNQELLPGMIISNEPGYYKANQYGIRIENLMLVKEISDDFLGFETLTLAPIDSRLIDFAMLTYPEKKWLKQYHKKIYDLFKKDLNQNEIDWLEKFLTN